MTKTSLDDNVSAFEAALLEYIVKYGLTDRARAAFAASGPDLSARSPSLKPPTPTKEEPT